MTDPTAGPTAVLFVPSTPMLLAEYVGLTDPAGDLRSGIVAVLEETVRSSGPTCVRIITDGRPPTVGRWTGPPLGERVGRRLLELAGWRGDMVVQDVSVPDSTAETDDLWLVVGDGSATRTERAPGHLDERSAAVDDQILTALSAADPQALLDVDPALAVDLMVSGLPALRAVATALLDHTDLRGEVVWSGDAFGVMYWLARWMT